MFYICETNKELILLSLQFQLVVELLNGQVKAILGPKSIVEAIFITELGEKSHVPIISFDNASYSHLHIQRPYLIRNAMANSFVAPIIALIKGFKWDKIAFVYEQGMFDTDIFPTLRDSFQTHGIHMSYMSVIPSNATDYQISNELGQLNQLETTVFVVHMRHLLGSRFFNHAKGLGMMVKGYAWVITDVLANSLHLIDAKLTNSLDGVIGIRSHVPSSRKLEIFTRRWKEHSHIINVSSITTHELSVYGSWAYDIIWALATGIEEIKNEKLSFVKANNSQNGGEISQLGISRVGHQLLKVINKTRIRGLNAKLFFSRDELATYQIFNLDGGQRIIGYWSPVKGISRELDSNDNLDSGQSNGTYDDLLHQLESKTVDAVVGDTTIMFNRSEYVDFTMPYSDPGSVMLVPIKDDNVKGMWVFIRPLNWDLWCTIAGACIFVGLAIHILERNGNLAPWKFGLFFWFPILILAFPERKIVENNWSSLKYEESQLRHYETMHDYASGLKNGCQNGGVDAIFNELPYIRLFMLTYGPKYMVVGRTYRTNGFGFAFPLGSPLVPYMSRAILNITESDMMQTLETSHFGTKYSSQDFNPQISPKAPGLNAYNFAGLFIITAFATIIALLCSESSFGKKYALKVKNYAKKRGSNFSSSQVVAIEDGDPVSRTDVSTNIGLPTHNHQDDANTHTLLFVEADGDSIIEEVELTIRHNRRLSL
ncbi:hypothetical protein L1887_12173 [Cichorium endivia]|nr:hypothetical protein L1887_12173 [Cichorium endivia]